MTTLVATDLDQTLIYSRAAVERHGGDVVEHVPVERYDGRDASWLTAQAAATLAALHGRAVVVPVTTRTPAQWQRIRLPGPPPGWAVAANGGVLLVDGEPDAGWARSVRTGLDGATPLAEVYAHAAQVCAASFTTALRSAEELFCYAVLDRERLPAGLVEAEAEWAAQRGWRTSLQGRKLYWVPRSLTKAAAVAEIARRVGADRVLAAGDSLLDADLLAAADRGIAARHGELVASGWRAAHVEITDGCGVLAGEQIVDWFAANVG